jgi:PadR family transcriptional regulator, regulatory protein AphA
LLDRVLTPTSYIVLGLLRLEPGTPYDLKTRVAATLGNFWSVQHAQLYTETARLAEEGLLDEHREIEGRRRKTYSITDAGSQVLEDWLETPTSELTELRDLSMLKVFFGADLEMLAPAQLEAHRAKVAEYEAIHEQLQGADIPKGMMITLEVGIQHERDAVRFWSSQLGGAG